MLLLHLILTMCSSTYLNQLKPPNFKHPNNTPTHLGLGNDFQWEQNYLARWSWNTAWLCELRKPSWWNLEHLTVSSTGPEESWGKPQGCSRGRSMTNQHPKFIGHRDCFWLSLHRNKRGPRWGRHNWRKCLQVCFIDIFLQAAEKAK